MKYILFFLMFINIKSFAQLSVQVNSSVICYGNTINFYASGSDDIISWYWDFGDGGFSTEQTPSYLYDGPGNYPVSLTVSNGIDTITKSDIHVIINPLPNAAFSFNPFTISIANSTIQFSGNNSGPDAVGWHWDFGGLGTSNDTAPTFTFPDTGTYIVTLTVVNEYACWDSIKYTIYTEHVADSLLIYPNPALDVFYIKDHAKYEKIYIINSNGNILREEESNEEIEISELNKGMYFIKAADIKNKNYIQKIIKK